MKVLQESEWLTTKEAANYLKIPVGSLLNLTYSGRLTYYKLGGRNRYLKSDLFGLLMNTKKGGFKDGR